MTHTAYVNASGLPDDDQLTTARDLAMLGRAIADRFPRYYDISRRPLSSITATRCAITTTCWARFAGVDGIKTGYTPSSGFNLVTSVHRDRRYIVAVVLGGHSAFARDAHMRELISSHIEAGGDADTLPRSKEGSDGTDRQPEPQPPAPAKARGFVAPRPDADGERKCACAR